MTISDLPTTPEVLALIRSDPMKGALLARKIQAGHRKKSYVNAAYGYELARTWRDNEEARNEFYSDKFWAGGYEKNPDNILLHALQWLCQERHGYEAKVAEGQAAAMRSCFEQRLPTELVLRRLFNRGGFSGMARAAEAAAVGGEGKSAMDKLACGAPSKAPASRPAPKKSSSDCRANGAAVYAFGKRFENGVLGSGETPDFRWTLLISNK